jgi:CRISP-associated protein Cas1
VRLLLLNGHGINIHVDSAKLHIKNGFWSMDEEPEKYVFSPKRIPYNDLIIYGHSGNLSLEAIKWLMKHGVGISILNWDGKLLTYIQPKNSVQVKTKFLQYQAYGNKKKRLMLAKSLLKGKFARTQEILNWLSGRYEDINTDLTRELQQFKKSKAVQEVIQIEARIAKTHWEGMRKVVPKNYEFESRQYVKRPMGSVDVINTLLNYGYALLESQCLKAIYGAGLDPYVGYLHEMASGKLPLAYDLQEPYRFLIDLVVIDAIERKIFTKKDFIRTENYNLRLRPNGAKKLTEQIAIQFSRKARYKGQLCSWYHIIQSSVLDLTHYLLGKKKLIDFTKPELELGERIDNDELREKILAVPYAKWGKLGYSKGTLHPLKQKAKDGKPFTVTAEVMEKIKQTKEELTLG